MTGKAPRKAVDGGHAPARLLQAREFRESARSLVTLAQSKSFNPAVTLMVTAAIAYMLEVNTFHGSPSGRFRAHAIQVARRVARNVTRRRRERKPLSCLRFSPRSLQYDIALM
jgi:hypothetical protein